MEFKINQAAVGKLEEYLAKVNKRAVKIGCAPLELREVSREAVADRDEDNRLTGTFQTFITFDVLGDTPKINGWEFVARIEHDEHIGNVLHTAPGKSLPVEFWESDCNCDHCGTKRIRKDTFFLRNEAGEFKQIGRQCVRDFIGYDNPADMYWWVAVMDDVKEFVESECMGNGIRSLPLFDTKDVICRALLIIDEVGYVSRRMTETDDRLMTTGDNVASTYTRTTNPEMLEWQHRIARDSVKFADKADAVIEWVKSWDEATVQKSEFNYNVHKMFSLDMCRGRDFGMIVCMPTMYMKHMDLLAEKTEKSNLHLGEVGQKKAQFHVTIKKVIRMEGAYGVTSMVIMEDEAGNCIKWNSSNFSGFGEGDVVVITGTIKAHDEYKGRNQTIMTRCSLQLVTTD